MNDLNFPVILAEFLAKSVIIVALGFAILAAIKRVFPADAKHRLWVRIFSVCLAIPFLLVAFPRWEIVPDLLAQPAADTPVVEMSTRPISYTTSSTPVSDLAIPVAEPEFQFSWPWTLFAIWGGGVAIFLFRSVPSGVYLRRIERSAEPVDGKILARFNELNQSTRSDRITLILSPLVKSPFTWGLTRARIALPESATTWSDDDLEMILLHELEHVRRKDALAVLISRLFLALNWINPFAWIAIHRAAQYREEACDQRVIRAGFSPENYAAMLFRQANTSATPILQTSATAVAETGTIEQRIKMILNYPSRSIGEKSSILSRLAGIATLLAILAIGISGCSDNEAQVTAPQDIPEISTPSVDGIAAIEQKLKTITVPSTEFSEIPLRYALAFLQRLSVALDVEAPDPA